MWGEELEIAVPESLETKMNDLNRKAREESLKQEEEAELRRAKNYDFIQFSREGLEGLSKMENSLAFRIFLRLTKEMNRENKIIVSQQTLAELLGVTRQSVSTAVKELISNKMLTILKTGSSSIYCLNADVVWSDRGDKKQYASFRATVLVSKKEQGRAVKVKKTKVNRIDVKK